VFFRIVVSETHTVQIHRTVGGVHALGPFLRAISSIVVGLMLGHDLGLAVTFPVESLAPFQDVSWTRVQSEASSEPCIKRGVNLLVVWAFSASVRKILDT